MPPALPSLSHPSVHYRGCNTCWMVATTGHGGKAWYKQQKGRRRGSYIARSRTEEAGRSAEGAGVVVKKISWRPCLPACQAAAAGAACCCRLLTRCRCTAICGWCVCIRLAALGGLRGRCCCISGLLPAAAKQPAGQKRTGIMIAQQPRHVPALATTSQQAATSTCSTPLLAASCGASTHLAFHQRHITHSRRNQVM